MSWYFKNSVLTFIACLGIARICNVMVLFKHNLKFATNVWGLPGFVMSWYEWRSWELSWFFSLGIARICNVMVLIRLYQYTEDHCLGIARICNVMVLISKTPLFVFHSLGIARICNVMVPKLTPPQAF